MSSETLSWPLTRVSWGRVPVLYLTGPDCVHGFSRSDAVTRPLMGLPLCDCSKILLAFRLFKWPAIPIAPAMIRGRPKQQTIIANAGIATPISQYSLAQNGCGPRKPANRNAHKVIAKLVDPISIIRDRCCHTVVVRWLKARYQPRLRVAMVNARKGYVSTRNAGAKAAPAPTVPTRPSNPVPLITMAGA